MNEKTKTIITLIIVFLIVMLLPLSLYVKQSNGQKQLDNLNEIFEKEGNNLFYIGSADCTYCNQFDPVIDSVAENYDFKYVYINKKDLTEKQFNELLSKFEIDQDEFGTPFLVTGGKGKKTAEKPGYMNETQLVEFLKQSEFLDEDVEPKNKIEDEETDALNFIDISELEKLVNNSDKSIIVLGQTGCGACIQAKPILNNIAKEKNVKINYLEIDLISDEEDYKIVGQILNDLGIEELYTPYLMVVQNKKELDNIIGLDSEDNYVKLFRQHGFIE